MKKCGACFVGCGEMVQNMGKKCIDIESGNGSQQSEDKKVASPMKVSPDETKKTNSNIIECFERSNISFLDFLFEFFLTFSFISFWSAFYVKTLSLFTFETLNTIIFSTLKIQVKSHEHEASLDFYILSKAYPVLPNDSNNPNFSRIQVKAEVLSDLSFTGMASSTPIHN